MKIFSAKFQILEVNDVSKNEWKMSGNVVDNTGNFLAADVKQNDVIYVEGNSLGKGILRYVISEIISADGAKLTAKVKWGIEDEEPVTPYGGLESIIGSTSKNLKLTAISDIFNNMTNEGLVSYARNFENQYVIDKLMTDFEKKLDNPEEDDYILSSKTNGQRIWIKQPSITEAINSLKDSKNGIPSLDENQKIPVKNIPSIAITDIFVVDSQEEMLKLKADKGDFAIIKQAEEDDNTGECYLLIDDNPAEIKNWISFSKKVSVESVNGKKNEVILSTKDIKEEENLYFTDERVKQSSVIQELQEKISALGDMKKEVYDKDSDGVIDRATLSDSTNSVKWENVQNKPSIPAKTSDLEKDDVYSKEEIDQKLKLTASPSVTSTGGGAIRYEASDSNGDCIVLATGKGVTFNKSGNTCSIKCPENVTLISARIHFSADEISSLGNCKIDFGTSEDFTGTGKNDDYKTVNPPLVQIINNTEGSRAYKVLPYPTMNLNTDSHTLQIAGLTSSVGVWVKLVF